ncbi:hypothetical protein CDAR_437001 [Caerostris darwini]|uniref:Uncharacterized protein n=1 Tax=Caerostris darwini TaxID=1538125 RepID=A0AAV4TSA4_9ARAC|nr:hypothetical protein CDAR_437001 [Caerostris darwini]
MKLLVFFCIVGAAFSLPDDVCNRSMSEVCTSEYPTPKGFPETVEDYNNICRYFSDKVSCFKEYLDKCGTSEEGMSRTIGILLEIIKDFCRRDSKNYRVIVSNWSCINGILKGSSEYCSLKETNTIKLLKDHLGSQEMIPFNHVTECLPDVLNTNCFVDQWYKKCGSDVKDAAVEFLDTMFSIKWYKCHLPKTLHPEFVTLLEFIEKLTKEEIYLKKLFQ